VFTGLITDIGEVTAMRRRGELARIRIACSYELDTLAIGASIACSGPCLTVVAAGADRRAWFEVEAAAETLARTSVGEWRPGRRINLERSLRIGDELGGHLVTGHVDAVARVLERGDSDGAARFDIAAPGPLARFIAEKGSIALDGVSLTVNSVWDAGFSVLLIPHTLAVTTWGERKAGETINLEVDLMARYAGRLLDKAH